MEGEGTSTRRRGQENKQMDLILWKEERRAIQEEIEVRGKIHCLIAVCLKH